MATEMGRRFGTRMRERRLDLDLKQREVAERMKRADPENADAVSKQHISDWERGVEPSDRYKPLIVKALEVPDVSWFYEAPKNDTPDVLATLGNDEDLRLARIEEQVSELHEALLGDREDLPDVAAIVGRLLQAAGWTPPQAQDANGNAAEG